ncbi:MAG TPA: hypothetical protein VFE47_31750 [Tepidisphaeraceae bacterium]|jgi:hypothetical protein|nr:hypothetical protein [Tepidisphaeraceae bacterium]
MTPDATIFEVFRRHGVAFIVIGGHAVYFHGYERLTEDTDIIWLRTPSAEAALLSALTEIEACYIGKEIDPSTGLERLYPVSLSYIRASHLMMLWTRHGFVDIFDYIPGFPNEDVRQIFSTSLAAHGYGYPSLEWLRKMKKASGRSKDMLDLENLPDVER